jgi:hypothetical protein
MACFSSTQSIFVLWPFGANQIVNRRRSIYNENRERNNFMFMSHLSKPSSSSAAFFFFTPLPQPIHWKNIDIDIECNVHLCDASDNP